MSNVAYYLTLRQRQLSREREQRAARQAHQQACETARQREGAPPPDRRTMPSRRRRLWHQQRGRCHYCGVRVPLRQSTLDHLQPRSRGGSDALANLAMACGPCNQAKGALTEHEYRELL